MHFSVDKKSKYTVYYFAFCGTVLLCLAARLVFYLNSLIFIIISGVISLAFLLLIAVYLPIYFKNSSARLKDDLLTVKRGVIFKKEFRVKCGKILYVQKISLNVSRRYSICVLKIHLTNGVVSIYPLRNSTADQIAKVLLKGAEPHDSPSSNNADISN